MKGNFEHNIKKSLDSIEPEFNSADWADMNSRLDAAAGKGKGNSNLGKGLLIAASVITAAGLIYYFSATSDVTNDPKNTVVENVAVEKNAVNSSVIQQVESTNDQPSVKDNTPANSNAASDNSASQKKSEVNTSAEPVKTDAPVVMNNSAPQNNSNQPPVQNNAEQTAPPKSVLSAAFRADNNKVCEGTSVQFTTESSEMPISYKWYFGDGKSSTEQNPKHTYTSAGNYAVMLKVTSAKDKKSDEQKNNIVVLEAPSVDMTYKADDDNKLIVRFDASTDKGADLKWEFGDKKSGSGENPEHTYAKFGTYKVILTAKNSGGCVTPVSKEIKVENIIKLNAPNAFTVNDDNLNDTWIPVAAEECTFVLTIYDIRGNQVYTTADKTPWTGINSKTGEKVKGGEMFTWVAVIKDKFGNITKDKGNIAIIIK